MLEDKFKRCIWFDLLRLQIGCLLVPSVFADFMTVFARRLSVGQLGLHRSVNCSVRQGHCKQFFLFFFFPEFALNLLSQKWTTSLKLVLVSMHQFYMLPNAFERTSILVAMCPCYGLLAHAYSFDMSYTDRLYVNIKIQSYLRICFCAFQKLF